MLSKGQVRRQMVAGTFELSFKEYQRFLEKLKVEGDCEIYVGATDGRRPLRRAYAIVLNTRFTCQAHVLAFYLEHGQIPEGMSVLHSCDNPRCCNPEHLSAGTHKENMRQGVERNRFAGGTRNRGAKLTVDQIAVIRSLHGRKSSAVVGREFEVNKSTVCDIWRGTTWKGTNGEPTGVK